MENRSALMIVVDGLRAAALATYGNTSVPTPLFDELASNSLVVEWLLGTSPTCASFYDGALAGIGSAGVRRWLMTDDPAIASAAPGGLFAEVVNAAPGQDRTARAIDATHAAAFFAKAVEQVALCQKDATEHQTSGLLWVHFSGLCGPWDAPLSLRNELLDEDDPPAPEFVVPPTDLRGVTDPDELLGYRVSYAAQVSVIEMCVAGLIRAFQESPFPGSKLAMIVGSRGFALGEHGCLGHDCQSLYGEQLHLPWLIMCDETRGPLPRVTGFAQPADLAATLQEWLSGDSGTCLGKSLVPFLGGEPGCLRDVVVASNTVGERMIRTPAWMMVEGESTELYAKPDDRWEANDVASRCPEVVDQLRTHLQAGTAGIPEPLTEELLSYWR